jgi:hypothetical protein
VIPQAPRDLKESETLFAIQDKCRELGRVLRAKGWVDEVGGTHKKAAQTPEAEAAEIEVMGLIEANWDLLTRCRSSYPWDLSPPLDQAFRYIGMYREMGPAFEDHVALANCLTVEVVQPEVPEAYRRPTFIVQLGRWARRPEELAALRQATAPVPTPAQGENTKGKAQGGGESRPPDDEEQDDDLPPSRLKAKAAYDYAMNNIAGADKMTVPELFDALRLRLDTEILKANGQQAERLQEFKDSLPDNAETFARYLRDAGIKRYSRRSDRTHGRSIRLQSEI